MKRFAIFVMVLAAGCGKKDDDQGVSIQDAIEKGIAIDSELPVFSIAVSEYPSWVTYTVAGKAGLINPKEGGDYGELEKKWGVDLVLDVKDYDACLTLYANGGVDAVCMTNMDSLNPALERSSTAICPTSTSVGADKVIAVGVKNVEDLKDQKVYGLSKSVSEYLWVRGLEKQNQKSTDYQFVNLDPAPAATALQSGTGDVKAICVWNPFALQTLRTNKKSTTVFDSSVIPEEIIDMVVVGNDSLKKESGDNFASLLCDVYYQVSDKLNSSDTKVADATLTALGEDFSNLPLEDMRIVVKETRFYGTPQDGIKLFSSNKFKETMNTVVKTCQKIGVLEKGSQPVLGFNDQKAQLNFDTSYMKAVAK